MAAAAPLPKLTIVKATYGQGASSDVTAKVSALVAASGGNLSIQANASFNQLFGDTEPNKPKLFHVVYQYGPNGAQKSMTHAEKHVDIYLPALEIKAGQVLTVNVIKAVGLRDTRTLGKQNPYAKLTTGSESFKTKVHEKGGTDPVWNQSFIFNLDGKDQHLHVVVYDKEMLTDDTIARFDIPLPTLAAATGEVAYNLVHPNDFKKVAGAIVLSCQFRDPNAPVVAAAAAAPAAATPAAAPMQPVGVMQPVVMAPMQPQIVYMQPAPVLYQAPPQPVFQMPAVYQPPVVGIAMQQQYQPQQYQQYQQPQQKMPEPQYASSGYGGAAYAAAAPSAPSPSQLAGAANQRWTYDPVSGHITSTFDGRVLDVHGASYGENARVALYGRKAPDGSTNQLWDYRDGRFVSRMGTNYVLAVDGGAANVKNDGQLVVTRDTGATDQQWDIDAYGLIRNRYNPQFCLDVCGGVPNQGDAIVYIAKLPLAAPAASQSQSQPAPAAAPKTVVRVKQQPGWRWCCVCQTLFFASTAGNGICAAGGSHDPSGSCEYLANVERDDPSSQEAWRWCYKCSAMCYPNVSASNVCPTGGAHVAGGEPYFMMRANQAGEQGFKWCSRCGVLAFAGKGGRCAASPAGHDFNGSGAYVLSRRQ